MQADLQSPALRKQNPDLKVPLSVGGWARVVSSWRGGDRRKSRRLYSFRAEIIQQYGLDGIDLTGEFPVNGAPWGLVASQPADRDNFTALLKSLREAVGEQKLVTIAVGAKCREPEKLGGRQSGGPGAELHQPDDLRHGLRHAVLQPESV